MMMLAYAILGSVISILLLALEFRLLLRIWSKLRWIHPSVHELGTLIAPAHESTVPTLLEIEGYVEKSEEGSAQARLPRRGEIKK